GSESLDPLVLAGPGLEGLARDTRRGDLDDDLAHPPGLPDERPGYVDTRGGDVLSERAVDQLPPQPLGPPVQVFPRVGVHRLLSPAVILGIAVLVARQPEPADLGRTMDGPFVDRAVIRS